jgi:hypothetical protein
MRAEHCTRGGSMEKFKTLNYTEIESWPKQEWEIIMKEVSCPQKDMRFNRRIPEVSELCELPLAKKAHLQKAEVIAIVMYTGPMVIRHCFIHLEAFISLLFIRINCNMCFICSMSYTTAYFVNSLRSCTRLIRNSITCSRPLFLFLHLLSKRCPVL